MKTPLLHAVRAVFAAAFFSSALSTESHAAELLRWDATNLRPDAAALVETPADGRAAPSGVLVVGPGLQRSAEPLERRLVVEFITRGPAFPGGVADSLEAGEYLKLTVRGAPGRSLSLTRLRLWVGVSAPKLKIVLVSNRSGLGDRDRLPLAEPEAGATEINNPALMWRGGTRYAYDLSSRPEFQTVPAGEDIEFYLVPVDVQSRYAFWGVSAKHESAIVIEGVE